jgi:hypothetical protein
MWMRWVGHVACLGIMRNAYKVLVGKPEGNISLGRPSIGEYYECGCDGFL